MKTISKLLGFLRPFFGEVFGSILLGVATVCAGIGMLGTSAFLIATAALHPSVAELQVAIVGVRFFGISRAAFRYLERLVSHSVNLHVLSRLREWFYNQVESVPPRDLNTHKIGDLLNRVMGDLETLENFYVRVVSPSIVAVVVGCGVCLFLGVYDPSLGRIMATGLMLNGLILPIVSILISRSTTRKMVTKRAELSAQTVEMLQSVEEINSSSAQKGWIDRLLRIGRESGRWQVKASSLSALNSGMGLLLMNLTIVGLIMAGIPLVRDGKIDGVSLAVILLMGMAGFESVANLPQAAVTLNSSLESAKRLFEFADRQVPVTHFEGRPKGWKAAEIRMEGLNFSYDGGDAFRLQEITFQLRQGKRLAMVGPSGAGKTSLVNLLLQLWEPSGGRILVDGTDARQLDPYQVRGCFSVIPQTTYLFSASLRDNLTMANSEVKDDVLMQVLWAAGLGQWVDQLPAGLDTWLGDQGKRLSGGECQRVAVARALLQDRPYILLDEPVENLDPITAGQVMNSIFGLFKDHGILLITHDFSFLDLTDEILLLENGMIVERSTPAQLTANRGKIAQMRNLQERILAI